MKPIKLEAGKTYRRSNGDVRTVTMRSMFKDQYGDSYCDDGKYIMNKNHWCDLIAEVPAGTVMVQVVEFGGAWASAKIEAGEQVQSLFIGSGMWNPHYADCDEGDLTFRIKPQPEPQPVGWKEAEAWMDGGKCCKVSSLSRIYKIEDGCLFYLDGEEWGYSEATHNHLSVCGNVFILIDKTPAQIEEEQG